jgi:hypothetical protein
MAVRPRRDDLARQRLQTERDGARSSAATLRQRLEDGRKTWRTGGITISDSDREFERCSAGGGHIAKVRGGVAAAASVRTAIVEHRTVDQR